MTLTFLENYILEKELPKGKTVEETINIVLESLALDPKNKTDVKYRYELIEATSVILNGLIHIKDPLKLYANLALAFEKRGFCIYKDTVKNAFSRLLKEILKQNKFSEFERIYFRLENIYTKKILIPELPKSFFLRILQKEIDPLILGNATILLGSKSDFSKKSLFDLILNPKQEISFGAIYAIANRSDFTYGEIFEAIKDAPNIFIKDALINILYSNPKFASKQEFLRFCTSKNFGYGNLNAVEKRPDLTIQDLIILSEYGIPSVKTFATQRLLKRTGDKIIGSSENGKPTLKYNSGKKGQRKRRMAKITRNLRL